MKRLLFVCFLLLLFCPLFAQSPNTPYVLPQTIFVGDSARLVVPLSLTPSLEPFFLDNPEKLPSSDELVIRRIELERRLHSYRLLIDFIAYAPGTLSLPHFEILSPVKAQEDFFAGIAPMLKNIEIQVASILVPSQMILSDPASTLAVPGTSFLVYGTIVFLLFLISLGIGGSIWSRRHFKEIWEMFRRRRLLRSMTKFIKRLKQECNGEERINPSVYLTRLSGEFREFLSLFSGINCRSLTAGEFLNLPIDLPFSPVYLCWLFRLWDTLRFSGKSMSMTDLNDALSEMENLITALDKAEKEKPLLAGEAI